MNNTAYIVMHETYADGWQPFEHDENGTVVFHETEADALVEIDLHLLMCRDAVKRGDMVDAPDVTEFAVARVEMMN